MLVGMGELGLKKFPVRPPDTVERPKSPQLDCGIVLPSEHLPQLARSWRGGRRNSLEAGPRFGIERRHRPTGELESCATGEPLIGV